MNVYYLTDLNGDPGRIVAVVYDANVFRFDESTLSSHAVLTIAEVNENKALCMSLAQGEMIDVGDDSVPRYHIDNDGFLIDRMNDNTITLVENIISDTEMLIQILQDKGVITEKEAGEVLSVSAGTIIADSP